MRKTLLLMLVLPTIGFITGSIQANHLDGLWHNDRDDITIRIESQEDGFRAKRIDQGIWYYYQPAGENIYSDRRGNHYEVIRENELIWRDSRTNNRISFHRVNDRERHYREVKDHGRDRRNWTRGDHAYDREYFEGTWMNRKTGQYLEIRSAGNGYQVRGKNDHWEKFSLKQDQVLRSRDGELIEMINPDMIRWSKNRHSKDQIFTRINNKRGKGKAKKHGSCCQ